MLPNTSSERKSQLNARFAGWPSNIRNLIDAAPVQDKIESTFLGVPARVPMGQRSRETLVSAPRSHPASSPWLGRIYSLCGRG
jgi:hypothetical protein